MNQQNDWTKWSQYVLKELEDLNSRMQSTQDCLVELKIEIAKMKERIAIRSTLWGAIGALVPVAVALLILFLKK